MSRARRRSIRSSPGGGFDQAFYNKYKDAELDNVAAAARRRSSKNNKTQSRYDLARAGLSRSSGASDVAADLEKQSIARTVINSHQSGHRRRRHCDRGIQGQQQSALNQLYATEDPSVAANTATGMVQQGQLSTPNLQPLGELFKPLVIGSIAAGGNLVDQYNINRSLQTRPPGGQGSVNYS